MDAPYDVIVAGAGFSGVVATSRLNRLRPEWRIALLDKDRRPGARLSSGAQEDNIWSFGLNALNQDL